jgi:MOSC domain-containing protein YiiM
MQGTVLSVNSDDAHRFSKIARQSIRLVEGYGIEGDAHAGRFVQHRYQAKKMPHTPNQRQVHLIQSELFEEMRAFGFVLAPGDLGENITTIGIDLLNLPLGARLHLGESAVVELTGLRMPCGLIDKFKKGLKRPMIVRTARGVTFRAGVLGIVTASGNLRPGDLVRAVLPQTRHALPAIE